MERPVSDDPKYAVVAYGRCHLQESNCSEPSTRRSPNRPLVFGQNALHAPGSCYNKCKSVLFLKVLLIRLQMVVVYESLICKALNRKMLVFWIGGRLFTRGGRT